MLCGPQTGFASAARTHGRSTKCGTRFGSCWISSPRTNSQDIHYALAAVLEEENYDHGIAFHSELAEAEE